MSKIICEVCGTAYPEASAQCPICGCVRPVDAQSVASHTTETVPERNYQYVKGGRFSKSNVKKRTAGSQSGAFSKPAAPVKAAPSEPTPPVRPQKKKSNSNMGLLITIMVLLLAIIAVVAYILIKFFLPAPVDKPEVTEPSATVEPSESETIGEVLCQDLILDTYEIYLENNGDYMYLTAMPDPFDTTEEILYESSDNSIVMAESDGRIIAVRKGEATVTVTCGAASVQCVVKVGIPQFVFELARQEVTFEKAGDTCIVYNGQIPMDDILWSTDDPAVAIVSSGVITAVGNGNTTIYGDYEGQIVSCVVHCTILTDPSDGATEATAPEGETTPQASTPTEPPATEPVSSEYKSPFSLKNLIGPNSQEVSLYIGESFSLALVDSNGTHIKGVTWTVEGSCCTVSDGTVKAVRSGNCVIVATYGGETYKCKIIVW